MSFTSAPDQAPIPVSPTLQSLASTLPPQGRGADSSILQPTQSLGPQANATLQSYDLDGLEYQYRGLLASVLNQTDPSQHEAILNDAKVMTVRAQLTDTKLDLAKTQTDLANTRLDLANTKAELAFVQADLATTKVNLATTTADLATTKAELATTKAELATTKAGLATAEADLTETKGDLRVMKRDFDYIQASLEDTQDDLDDARNALIPMEASLEEAESLQKTTEEALAKLRRKTADTNARYDYDIQVLSEQIEDVQADLSTLQGLWRQYKHKVKGNLQELEETLVEAMSRGDCGFTGTEDSTVTGKKSLRPKWSAYEYLPNLTPLQQWDRMGLWHIGGPVEMPNVNTGDSFVSLASQTGLDKGMEPRIATMVATLGAVRKELRKGHEGIQSGLLVLDHVVRRVWLKVNGEATS